ncbi:MAG: hypothetical protein ABSG09_07620 [Acidimicrobiales bacterium]
MNNRASRFVTYGQWNLVVFVIFCLSLHPGFVLKRDEGGFSNYGIHVKTVIPYTLTYLGCVIFTLIAAKYLPVGGHNAMVLARLLRSYALLCLLLLVTTYGYSLNTPLKDVHGVVGLAAMVFDPAASVWLFLHVNTSVWDRILVGVELAGLVLGVIDLLNVAHVLFASQAVIAVGFGFLLARGTHYIERQPRGTS